MKFLSVSRKFFVNSRIRNVLDHEASGLPVPERLDLLRYAIARARLRARTASESQELDYVEANCFATIAEIENGNGSDVSIEQRIARMTRVVHHYEGRMERFNRRYWWFFFLLGLATLVIQIATTAPASFL